VTHKINTSQLGPIARRSLLGVAIASALHAPVAFAQEANTADDQVEVIEVKGFTSSLKASMLDKKASDVVYDGITAEDLGKFPD
jgi:iron complex outermembrane recepter protein